MSALAVSGEIVGRKKLQKMIYISKKLAFPFQEKFQFHFYGPYSEELTLRVEELFNLGFINEVKEKKGGYSQYRYTLTDNGKEFLSLYESKMPHLDKCLQDLNEQSARFLELVSTILFFDSLSREEATEKIKTLKAKQQYSEQEIEEAYLYFEKLKQIAKLQ
jgi:uncharacterized protein YwgA